MAVQWADYVRRVTRGQTQAQIAAKTGIAESNVGRWIRGQGGQPKPDSVVVLARAYNQPTTEALIAAGWLAADDVDVSKQRTPLSAYSNAELLDELRRRTVND